MDCVANVVPWRVWQCYDHPQLPQGEDPAADHPRSGIHGPCAIGPGVTFQYSKLKHQNTLLPGITQTPY